MVVAAGYVDAEGRAVATQDALRVLAEQGHAILIATAGRYDRVLSAESLARRVQDATGIRVLVPSAQWLPKVLTMVAHRCRATGEPALTSLVTAKDGTVGPVFSEVLRLEGRTAGNAQARERLAAEARLACYRRYATHVPADAAPNVASATRGARATGARVSRGAPPLRPEVPNNRICPRCFLETPIAGECQNCA